MNIFLLKHKKAYYAVLIALVSLCMISLSFHNNLWADEAFSLLTVRKSIPDMWTTLSSDVHPFLYYWILKFFVTLFGASVFVGKLVSILPMVLNMLLGATLVDKYFGDNKITIPSFFILIHLAMDMFLYAALEIRMYSWALFFVTASGLLAYAMYQDGINKNRTCLFVATSIAAAATHYFALASVAIIYALFFALLILKDKTNFKYCLAVSVATIILYLPGLFIFLGQFGGVADGYWIAPFTISTIVSLFISPFVFTGGIHEYIMSAGFLLCAGAGILCTVKQIFFPTSSKLRKKALIALCFICVFFLLTMIGLTVSLLITPMYIVRYGMPTYALLWLGIVYSLIHLPSPKVSKILLSVLCVCMLCSSAYFVREEYFNATDTGATQATEYINAQEGDFIIASDISHLAWTVLAFYIPDVEIITYNALNFDAMDEGAVVYFFKSSNTLDDIQAELSRCEVEAEYIYSGNIDGYVWHLYKLTK